MSSVGLSLEDKGMLERRSSRPLDCVTGPGFQIWGSFRHCYVAKKEDLTDRRISRRLSEKRVSHGASPQIFIQYQKRHPCSPRALA